MQHPTIHITSHLASCRLGFPHVPFSVANTQTICIINMQPSETIRKHHLVVDIGWHAACINNQTAIHH